MTDQDTCEVANHFNIKAAASGECEWCADIAKAHAAGRVEMAAEVREALREQYRRVWDWSPTLTAILAKLPEAE